MHHALREMPGPRTEMTAIVAHWDQLGGALRLHSCGHVAPLLVGAEGEVEHLDCGPSAGLGGRQTPTPGTAETRLESGDRLVLVSDGVVHSGVGQAGLGEAGLLDAVLSAGRDSASETVRAVHGAVLDAAAGELSDDATAVCLLAG
jgi:serine phosphatase RsbU (regulator of sigma subunit)